MKLKNLILLAVLCMASCEPVFAQSNSFNYQARLNQPLPPTDVVTTLYADSSGDSVIWSDFTIDSTDSYNVVGITLGLNPLRPLPPLPTACWLGLTIGAQQIRPLTLVGSVPYAIIAQTLSTPYIRSFTVDGLAVADSVDLVSDTVTGCLKLAPK